MATVLTTDAVGFSVSSGSSLDLVIVQNTTTKANKYTGLQARVINAGLVGVGDLELTVSGDVQVNKGPAAGRLDWSAVTGVGNELPAVTLTMDHTVKLAIRDGSVALNMFGFVVLAGSFDLVKQTGVAIDDGATGPVAAFTADVLSLSLTAGGFVGVGGALSASNDSLATVVTADAVGFSVPSSSLDLVIVQDTETPANKYTGLQVSLTDASLVGMAADLVLTVSGDVQVNKGPAGGDRLDWTEVAGVGNELSDATLTMDHTVELEVSGSAELDVFGFVQVYGAFAFKKSSDVMATLSGQTTPKTFQVTTVGFEHVDVFVGAGPYFVDSDGNGQLDDSDVPDADAVGLVLEDVSLALALFKPTSGSGSYYAVSASASFIGLTGLGDSDSFALSADVYRVEVSGGTNDVAVNFTSLPGGKLSVPTGTESVDFDYTSPLIRVAIEKATLIIGDYVHISGDFSFTKQTGMTATLSDSAATTREVNSYAFAAGSLDMFVGSGPYFVDSDGNGQIDELDERNEDAIGLALENVNFGLILMRPTAPAYKSMKYLALNATANYAGFVGIDNFKLSGSDIEVAYNTVTNPNDSTDTTVVDFSKMSGGSYSFDTGNGELDIDYSSKLLRASAGEAVLEIDSYVHVRGGFTFEKGKTLDLTLSGSSATTKEVTAMDIGAQNVSMFFGVNGPYRTDSNGDGLINSSDETNDDAVGFAITNANVAFTLLKPTLEGDRTKYIGMKASADDIGFVGTDVFQLEASVIEVDLNLASGKGVTAETPVADFVSSYPSELLALFDTTDDTGASGQDGVITVGELRVLNGQAAGSATSYSSTVGELYGAAALADDVVELDEVVRVLDEDVDGILKVSEAQTFLATDTLADDADADSDQKLDPVGYEISTGSDVVYLSDNDRRIHASADDVLINMSEFLYLNGSVAFDLGSRETVILNT
ncbi:MAG: hypothetical protein QGG09_16565, partial [Pirellulaceae bacterium]|nr:hypothetical protein [Pirellulaceae bacterium]